MNMKIITLFILSSLLIFVGCSTKSSNNPFDPRNNNSTLTPISGFKSSDSVDSSSSEGEELVNFKWGEHNGELKYLNISIEYLDYFYTDDEGYPVYYIGLPMRYRIRIENTGCRTFEHLEVIAIQEYYEDMVANRWWYPYPAEVVIHKGDPMPGESIQVWKDVYLGPHSEIVLEDTYVAPIQTCAGLDQTHLIIKHYNNGELHAAVIYDNPEQGVFCPPPPEN